MEFKKDEEVKENFCRIEILEKAKMLMIYAFAYSQIVIVNGVISRLFDYLAEY